jgi:hypothetical protein
MRLIIFRDHKHALQALQNMNENSERFGLSGKQVNVQFAIENSLILKKREERIRVSGDFLKRLTFVCNLSYSLTLRLLLHFSKQAQKMKLKKKNEAELKQNTNNIKISSERKQKQKRKHEDTKEEASPETNEPPTKMQKTSQTGKFNKRNNLSVITNNKSKSESDLNMEIENLSVAKVDTLLTCLIYSVYLRVEAN